MADSREAHSVRGINVRGVSRGLVSLLFPSEATSRLGIAKKERKKPSGKINERAALMNHLDASKTASEKAMGEGVNGNRRVKKMDCEEELDIAIKHTANLTNWRLNFFLEPPSSVATALKTSRVEGRGKRVLSRYGKKIHRGSSARLAHSSSIQSEKKRVAGLCVATGER